MTQDQPRPRRRRRRAGSPAGPPPVAAPPAAPSASAGETSSPQGPAKKRHQRRDDAGERGLRDLAGAGSSRLGVDGALRARDVNRPTADDLADAERDLQVVRRNWQPSA